MIGNNLDLARKNLINGYLVAIPTETVYGLGANAYNENAILKVFEAKNRPKFNPLILHSYSINKLDDFLLEIPDKAKILAEKFMPGPLTLLLPKKDIVTDLITAGSNLVAVRIPNHPLTLELLSSLEFPLVAPSANPFGYISPTSALHVQEQLAGKVSYILDGGECNIGIESTIIGFEGETPIIHRLGGLSIEEIEKLIGKVRIDNNNNENPEAPGKLKMHYSPNTKSFFGDFKEIEDISKYPKIAHIRFDSYLNEFDIKDQFILSKNSDLAEAAKNLFSYLRQIDSLHYNLIIFEPLPNIGLGMAINDRLMRASS